MPHSTAGHHRLGKYAAGITPHKQERSGPGPVREPDNGPIRVRLKVGRQSLQNLQRRAALRTSGPSALAFGNHLSIVTEPRNPITAVMKFRDGMWHTAEGFKVEYAEEVYQITETAKGLSLLCPTRKVVGRGATLNTSTLTIVRTSNERSTGVCGELTPFLGHRGSGRWHHLV